jgi:ABC-2 type transport system permease protein
MTWTGGTDAWTGPTCPPPGPPGFLQTIARILPLYYVNEGLRAAMVSVDHTAALRYCAMIGVFATVVFVLGINTTKWDEGAA